MKQSTVFTQQILSASSAGRLGILRQASDQRVPHEPVSDAPGMSPKHISTVINGEKSISVAFARKLAYALGIEAAFWINLQTNYDKELLEYEDLNSISKEELAVTKRLKEVCA